MRARAAIIAGAAAVLALAACTTPEERAARARAQLEADRAECAVLGFTPDTQAFAECLLRLREIRAAEANARAIERAGDTWMWGPSWGGPGFPYRRPYW